jgi:hypothetical protein
MFFSLREEAVKGCLVEGRKSRDRAETSKWAAKISLNSMAAGDLRTKTQLLSIRLDVAKKRRADLSGTARNC